MVLLSALVTLVDLWCAKSAVSISWSAPRPGLTQTAPLMDDLKDGATSMIQLTIPGLEDKLDSKICCQNLIKI